MRIFISCSSLSPHPSSLQSHLAKEARIPLLFFSVDGMSQRLLFSELIRVLAIQGAEECEWTAAKQLHRFDRPL